MPPRVTSSFTPEEARELKAHHLACSHLLKGCQDAVIKLRQAGAPSCAANDPEAVKFRAVEILEEIVGSWSETLSILRANLNRMSSDLMLGPARDPSIFANDKLDTPLVSGKRGVKPS